MQRITRLVLATSICANLAGVCFGLVMVERKGGIAALLHRPSGGGYRVSKEASFHGLTISSNDIVVFGDSIADLGRWAELLDDPHLLNRGISGETTAGALSRSAEIAACRPRAAFLICGINDIQGRVPLATTVSNVVKIAEAFRGVRLNIVATLAPEPTKYARVIVPYHPAIHMPTAAEVAALNRTISAACATNGCNFIPLPMTTNGAIAPELTDDGLHPNGYGMRKIAEAIASNL